MKTAIATLVIAIALIGAACAAVPPMINYQGKLMQPSGAPVPDNTYTMQFAIYDDPASTDPAHKLWGETNPSVQVKGGLFAVLLGSVTPLPSDIFDGQNRFFGVKVGADPEMTPRQQIASTAFAFRAAVAGTVDDGAITTGKLADGAVTAGKLGDGVVGASKIADLAVTSSKVAPAAITSDKIADGAITAALMEPRQPWVNVTYENGWHDYLPHPEYQGARFMKDILGFVHIQGLVQGGTPQSATVFTLPPGYRPLKCMAFGAVSNGPTPVLCAIWPDGRLLFENGANDWVAISAITFLAEQ